jgi:hypothetical protein
MRCGGQAPYVTAAASNKALYGQTFNRAIGGETVPLRVTDYGPGVRGLDIAYQNPAYATNYPFQGGGGGYAPQPTKPEYAYGTGSNLGQMGSWNDYYTAASQPSPTQSVLGGIAGAFKGFGQSMSGGSQGINPLSLLGSRSSHLPVVQPMPPVQIQQPQQPLDMAAIAQMISQYLT